MTDIPPAPKSSDGNDAAGLDAAFLALLCCPVCPNRPALEFRAATASGNAPVGARLHCGQCQREYPIVDGIPDLRPTDERVAAAAVEPS